MSTRAVYTFTDFDTGAEYHVYKHHDGYPEGEHGGIATIEKALKHAWPLPRYEADEFGAAFVAANKDCPGGVRLLISDRKAFPCDIAYHYVVNLNEDNQLTVECRRPPDEDTGKLGTLIERGTLKEMKAWAEVPGAKTPSRAKKKTGPAIVAVNQCGDHRTGSLSPNITPAQIQKVLGFKANIADDDSKVKYSWGFTVNGKRAGIWDYKGSRWSIYDPDGVVPDLFKDFV